MNSPEFPSHFETTALTREFAVQHIVELTKLANEIPIVRYTEKEILAESKERRVFHGKWSRSLVVTDEDKPIALLIAYERESENNEQYPANTLYMSELAVSPDYRNQGIARNLIQTFLDTNNATGLLTLGGKFNYSLQTNSADWNAHVVELYYSFGFKVRSTKTYSDAVDFVLGYTPNND